MKYNVLFSDMDGTLLKTDKTISPATKKALDDFVAAGGRLVLTSGRPPESILEVAEKQGILYKGSYIIAYNGAMIYDCDERKVIHKEVISREDVSLIEQEALSHNLHIHTYEGNQVVSHVKDDEILYYTTFVHMDIKYLKDYGKELIEEPMKMIAIDLHDHGKLNVFKDAIKPILKDRVQVLFSTPMYLEFLPVNAGKGNAVAKLCEMLNIPLDHAIAIGDEENDISMIKTAGLGVAMKNGSPLTRESADLVTDKTNDEDAFVDLIQQILTND